MIERPNDFSQQLISLLFKVGRGLRLFINSNAIPLLFCILLVFILVVAGSNYRDRVSTRRITVLVGPSGGSTEALAQDIGIHFQTMNNDIPVWDFWSKRYVLDPQMTDGYEQNRAMIDADRTGDVIGFTHDGFGDSKNVLVLLPLDRNCLHVIASREFLKKKGLLPDTPVAATPEDVASVAADAAASGAANELHADALTFGDVAKHLQLGRVYLGPLDSGTRQCAEYVLREFNLDPGRYASPGIANWYEMRSGLNRGFIDIGFYGGPLGASIMEKIAADGNCQLLGLGNSRDAIVSMNAQLLPAEIHPHSYKHGEFCATQIETFGSRRVLICSSAMGERDAYFIASVCRTALQHRIPEISWETRLTSEDPKNRELIFPLHPAAQLLRDDLEPTEWSDGTYYVLMTLGLWASYALLRWLNGILAPGQGSDSVTEEPQRRDGASGQQTSSQPEPVPPTIAGREGGEPETEYAALNERLLAELAELEVQACPLTAPEFNDWGKRIDEVRMAILSARGDGTISKEQAHTLLQGIRKELEFEYGIRRPEERRRQLEVKRQKSKAR